MRQGNILIPVVVAVMSVAAFLLVLNLAITAPKKTVTNSNTADTNEVACIMDAKVCPDGSSVGRVPPKCGFAACPMANGNTNVATNTNTTNDATKDWKMYVDGTLSFSLKYPPAWQTKTKVCGENDPTIYLAPSTIECDAGLQAISIIPRPSATPLAYAQAQAKIFSDAKTTTVIVDGQPGYRVTGTVLTDPTLSGRGTFLHDTVYVNISGHVWELASALDGYTETFTQILLTFHVSGPTAGWKTYTNANLGISLKHPDGWTIDETSTPNKVWFNSSGSEMVDSVEVRTTTQTPEQWSSAQEDVQQRTSLTVGGLPAIRIDRTTFNLSEWAVKNGDRLYLIRSNKSIKDLNILSTFTFKK